MTQEEIERLNALLKENKDVNEFILDFVPRFRFPDFATNTIDDVASGFLLSCKTPEKISKSYRKDVDKAVDKYKDNVRDINEKEAKNFCENDNLLGLKNKLDGEKNKIFTKIIDLYNKTKNYGYTAGRISDFMLYDVYMDYITDEEIFYYDDDNPYVVELFDNINNFLKMRSRIELNCSNIDGLITKFTKLCDSRLKKYWNDRSVDYYSRMKEIFQYDFYTDDEDNLIQSTIDGKNRVTLYSKVLSYLKNLTGYEKPISASEKYKDKDAETVIKSDDKETSSEKKNRELLSDLKKIALTFVNLRKIEVDNRNYSYFKEYISERDLKEVFTLRDKLAVQLVDIKEYSTRTINVKLLANRRILKKYLGALRGITQNESRILRELSDRAINWYLTNGKGIDDGSIFNQFKSINWSSPTTIFKDNEPTDFFFLEDEELESTQNKEDGYDYTEDSLKTKYGVNSYAYWLRYCTVATLVNCMLPMYWPTGIIIGGAPVKLPIIFIPFIVISDRVLTVIGIGLCGICPLPMILFMNLGDLPGFAIPVMNMAVDMLKKLSEMTMELGISSIKGILAGLIKVNDSKINSINDKISQIETDMHNMEAGIETDKETLRELKKAIGKNSTTNSKK